MERYALAVLEFDELRALLSRYSQTPLGRRQLLELAPMLDLGSIERAHQEVAEAIEYQREHGRLRISEMEDPAPVLLQLGIADTRLSAEEMLQLQNIINIGTGLRQQFREVREHF